MADWKIVSSHSIQGYGSQGYFTITPSAGIATVDLVNGMNQRLVLNGSPVVISAPIFTGVPLAAGMSFKLYFDQDASGSRAVPTFAGGPGGFVSDTDTNTPMDPTPSTRTAISFTFHGTYWAMDNVTTGIQTS